MSQTLARLALSTLVIAMAACGGGGSGDTASDTPVAGGGAVATPPPSANTAAGAVFKPTGYRVYKYDLANAIATAGGLTNRSATSATLNLSTSTANDQLTNLRIIGSEPFTLSATQQSFYVFNRLQGRVLMLCNPLGGQEVVGLDTKSMYAAVATNFSDDPEGARYVGNLAELTGRSFVQLEDCAFVGRNNETQRQNNAPDADTKEMVVQANGSATLNDGGLGISASEFNQYLIGNAVARPDGSRRQLSFWKFTLEGKTHYVGIGRGHPTAAGENRGQGYVSLWLER